MAGGIEKCNQSNCLKHGKIGVGKSQLISELHLFMDQAQTVLLIRDPAFLRKLDIVTPSITWLIGTLRGANGKYLLFLGDFLISNFHFCVSGSLRCHDGDVKLKGILKMNIYFS